MRLTPLAALALAGCGAGAGQALPTPAVTMRADPPPPYTYWAPVGSTVVNHPSSPGVWIAEDSAGERLAYYIGDNCGAAARQGWVGQTRADVPGLEPGPALRVIEPDMVVTSDLIRTRLNVSLDAEGRILDVSCG